MRAIQILTACGVVVSTSAAANGIDWAKIDTTFGRTAGVAQVTLDGVTIRPAFALAVGSPCRPNSNWARP
jgi:hypothetical protein